MEARVLAFLAMVRSLRSAQREFFQTHNPEALVRAKQWEREVDKAEAALRKSITGGEQAKLF